MTDIDLAAIRERLTIVEESRYGPLTIKQGRRADEALEELVTTDLPALLAEVERLRADAEWDGDYAPVKPTSVRTVYAQVRHIGRMEPRPYVDDEEATHD